MFSINWNLTLLAVLMPLVCLTSLLGQSGLTESSYDQPSNGQLSNLEPVKVTLTIDMDDNKLAVLRKTGLLRIAVPPAYQGKLDTVRLKREISFKSEDFELPNAVDKLASTLTVSLDEALLDQLDYQPIKANVYYAGFTSVSVIYTRPKAGDPLGLAERENKPTLDDSTRFFVRVDDKRGMYGFMTGLAKLKLDSDFGEVMIDTTEVAGIKFNAHGSGSVAVRLNSGASISGNVDFDEIIMKCSWGTQKISLDEIESIVANRKYQFVSDPYHSGRWIFKTDLVTPPEPVFNDMVPGIETPMPVRSLPYNP